MKTAEKIRSEFPILNRLIYGKPLVYFDNAATSQKPVAVIQAINEYYETYNSNIHRGAHYLANFATEKYESAREKVANFLSAAHSHEINFVRGTTEAVNLVANAYGNKFLGSGDEIIISGLEHHSNIVPWQMLCERKGCTLKIIPVLENGELDMEVYKTLLNSKTALVSVAYVSNALGTINPIKEIIQLAHDSNAICFIDGAQAAPHIQLNVRELDCDFLAFSGHKVYGPTGIGVLYGKESLLNRMDPWMGGGEMISEVRFEKTTYNQLPYKFEAGTPNIEGGIALGTSLDWLGSYGIENLQEIEQNLLHYATTQLSRMKDIRIIGTSLNKTSVISFVHTKHHPFDIGTLLDQLGIAIRTGHHCCQPLMSSMGIDGTCRISFAAYNQVQEVDYFIDSLTEVIAKLNR